MITRVGIALCALLAGAVDQAQLPPSKAAATGTAVVSGVVVSAGQPAQPVRRAIVKLSGRGEMSRSAVTDDQGRFSIGFLPGGTYTLTVSKAAYVTTTYGALGVEAPGTPFVLRDGETVNGLRIPLTKGAAISGTIRDHTGQAAEGVQVFVSRAELAKGRRTEAPFVAAIDQATTDDTGAYRIFGLAPGTYLVSALPRPGGTGLTAPTREQVEAELRTLQQRQSGVTPSAAPAGPAPVFEQVGYAPIFHPSAVTADQAAAVSVNAGDDKRGIDIFLALVPMTTVEGVVMGVDGQPMPNVLLNITTTGPPLPPLFGLTPLSSLPGTDASFRFQNVAPGTWTITARSSARVVRRNEQGGLISSSGNANDIPAGTFYWGAATVDARGGTTKVTINMRPGVVMKGRVVFDSATAQAMPNPTSVRLSMSPDPDPAREAAALFPVALPAVTNPIADGSFELRGLTPGSWLLSAIVPGASGPTGWWLRSAMVGARDLLDAPLELTESDLNGVEITLTNRHTELAGSLLATDGKPISTLAIIAMPAERALWSSSRRVQQTRPATNGRFSFADLPPGNYLLVAVTETASGNWRTEEFLAAIAPTGVKVTIGEGQKVTQDLKVQR